MKKVLFATTALVASAGIASAQGVTLSGMAEMGIVGGDVYGNETQFWTDVDVTFTFAGETDNGLTFGGSVDLDETTAFTFNGTTQGGETIFISGAFGTLTMGDTDGALDWAMQDVGMNATIDDTHTTHAGYNGNNVLDGVYDGQIARYDYSFGDFAFAASVELDDTGANDPMWSVGAKYSANFSGIDLGFGIGYQTASVGPLDPSALGASIEAKFGGGFHVIGNYTSFDDLGGLDAHYGIGLGYTTGPISLSVNYGQYETTGVGDPRGVGLQAAYDLGGGAEIQAGYGYSEVDLTPTTTADANQFSLGVAMSF